MKRSEAENKGEKKQNVYECVPSMRVFFPTPLSQNPISQLI